MFSRCWLSGLYKKSGDNLALALGRPLRMCLQELPGVSCGGQHGHGTDRFLEAIDAAAVLGDGVGVGKVSS